MSKNVLVLNKSLNADYSYQETIESYLDDIFRIIKCTSHSYVTSCDISDNNAMIYGKTKICLTYRNEEGEILYADFLEDFCEKISLDGISDNAFVNAVACDKYCNFRVINQRRIDVHTTFLISVKVYDSKSVSVIGECEGSKLNEMYLDDMYIENSVIERLDFEDEIPLSAQNNGIKRVISFDSNIKLISDKTVKDKVFIKACVSIDVLYTNNNNEIEKISHSFDVSKIFEIVGIDDDSKCFVDLYEGCFYLKAKSYSDNENSKIEIYGDVYANINVLKEEKRKIILDGYIIGHKMNNSYSGISCCTNSELLEKQCNDRISIKLTQQIKKIISFSARLVQSIKKGNYISSEFCFKVLYETVDGDVINFENSREISTEINNENCLVLKGCLNSFDYNIVDDTTINVNVDYVISGCVGREYMITVLSDMCCGEESYDAPALTLYFARTNESIWDIAKKFSSDTELIKSENDIKADTLEFNKVLIIPGL